ncbi:ribosome silencing factor [Clostridium sp. 'deep sea']|uniref:ribosome silencing factor n=1 Tax=Clostridium sp. 'deep sea' TaxID=2779445 RepID=UPI001A9B16B6|nr:ribosome silencing factor [Clostridium sp. 'deep sea']
MQIKERALKAIEYAQEKKANRPVLMDLRKLTAMTDYFVILSATNTKQVEAIAEHISKSFKDNDELLATTIERDKECNWILLDYADFIVHVFNDKARDYYDLERLWSDAEITEVL